MTALFGHRTFFYNLNYFHDFVIKVNQRVLRAHYFSTCEERNINSCKIFSEVLLFLSPAEMLE